MANYEPEEFVLYVTNILHYKIYVGFATSLVMSYVLETNDEMRNIVQNFSPFSEQNETLISR